MSKTWPAFDKWAYEKTTEKSYFLQDAIGPKTKVTAFVDADAIPEFSGLTFDNTYSK